MSSLKAILCLLGLLACAAPANSLSNAVVDWQDAIEQIVRDYNISNQISARYFALTNIAEYQALLSNQAQGNKVDTTAVAAFAAHYILSYYFPQKQNVFDGLIAKQLGNVSEVQKLGAKNLAQPYAIKLITSRVNDSTQQWAPFKPAPQNGPAGAYQFTPNQTFALYPQLANATTFATPTANPPPSTQSGATFTNASSTARGPAQAFVSAKLASFLPYRLDSPQYTSDLNTVQSLGSLNSNTRTPYQTNTSWFWADLDGTSTINGHFYTVAKSLLPNSTSLLDTAALFARLGAAQFDSNVVGWYIKYNTLFWRPITAIRQGDGQHAAVAEWRPLLNTPAHPEYPSTHTVSASAAGQILARWFGSDNTTFTVGSEYKPVKLQPRTFNSFSEASLEVGWSRVYGGIHFPKSGPDGQAIGKEVADNVYNNFPAALDSIFGTSFAAAAAPAPSQEPQAKPAAGRRLAV